MRPNRRLWITIGASLAFVFGASAVAIASNFASTAVGGTPPNNVNLANNATHLVYFGAVGAQLKSATLGRMSSAYTAATDVTMSETTSSTNYDVRVLDNSYGLNGAAAWVVCPPAAIEGGTDPSRWCFGQDLRYNLSYPNYYDTASERSWLACHELGHTIGLKHTTASNSCLRETHNGTTLLSSHDISHVNSNY